MKEKIKEYLMITGFVIIGLIIGYVINRIMQPPCPPEGKVLVEKQWLDSLQAIAKMKPDTILITVDSIIYKKGPVEYVEVPVPVEINDTTNYYSDTITTEHFDLYLFDTLRYNQIVSRGFNYDLYVPEKITETITLIQKVPFPYEVDKRKTIYGGINIGAINSVDLNYRLSDRNDMIGIGFGYDYTGKKMIYGRYTFPIW
ncbi:MAG: hypothetical protein ACLFVR_14655 [Thiohalospira sp.]